MVKTSTITMIEKSMLLGPQKNHYKNGIWMFPSNISAPPVEKSFFGRTLNPPNLVNVLIIRVKINILGS